MPISFFDRVKETSTTTGTGSFTLAGAVTGFRAFSSVLSVGSTNLTVYAIANDTANQWEIGLGYLSASTTLVRSVIYRNSSGTTSALNFSAGTKNVFITQPAKFGSNNHMLSDNVAGTPESRTNFTAFGYNTSIGGDSTTAVGASSTASASSASVFGAGATASGISSSAFGNASTASSLATTAVGATANAATQYATAVGYGASVTSSDYGTAVGQYSSVTGNNAVAFGGGNTSSGYQSIAVGVSNTSSGNTSIVIGSSSTASGNNSIAIGPSLNANQTEQFLTYMRVSPAGLSGVSVKYDSSTRELYAESGGGGGGVTQIIAGTGITITSTGPGGTGAVTINASGGGGGPNWATYQDNDMTPASLSLATPSSTTSSPYSTWFFSNSAGPTGSWMYQGMVGGPVGATYSNSSYPISTPITGGPPFGGSAVCYFPSYHNDIGASSTFQVAVGSSLPNYFSSVIYIGGGWPVFGATRFGHFIAAVQGMWSGTVTPMMAGVTLVDEFYDQYFNNTYFFFDCDSSAVSSMSGGSAIATFGGGTASYYSIFWYNY